MIRVLRLMEYEFDSFEIAEKHLAQCSVPANGSKNFGPRSGMGMIRSVILVTPFSVALDAEPTPTCTTCGRDLHGYKGPLCRYCDPEAFSE